MIVDAARENCTHRSQTLAQRFGGSTPLEFESQVEGFLF
jgi:hypothetical protein